VRHSRLSRVPGSALGRAGRTLQPRFRGIWVSSQGARRHHHAKSTFGDKRPDKPCPGSTRHNGNMPWWATPGPLDTLKQYT
jgi:hypothetical protein